MMRLNPLSPSTRRVLGLLALGLTLGLWAPTPSQGALMRYTLTTTLAAGSTLAGTQVGGSVLTVYADIESTTTTVPAPYYQQASTVGPVYFRVGTGWASHL